MPMAERKKTAVARPRPEEGGRGQEQSKGQGLVSGRSRGHGSEATELEGVVRGEDVCLSIASSFQ